LKRRKGKGEAEAVSTTEGIHNTDARPETAFN
jgi:hypothetical protein